MNLTIVTETYPPEINGVALTLGHLVAGLAQRGHEVTIVRPRQRHESPNFSVTQRVACRQVRLPGVPMPGYPQLRLGLPASRTLRRLWHTQPPDLVHAATEGPRGASAITAAHRLRVPVTSSFHTNFHQYTRDYRLGWLHGIVAAWLRRVHNRTRLTFVPTRALQQSLAADGYHNLRILSRGVDTHLFTPEARDESLRLGWGGGPNDLVVVHIGRMAPEKNYPLRFRTFDAVRSAVPGARLVLVGDGPQLARLQASRPDAIYTGFYLGPNLARHYASGDLYLHASVTETFGNVIPEAMASGLAVSGFNYAAAQEFIRHDDNGLVAPLGDEQAFVANAIRLALNPALRLRLATAARQTAERISWDTVIGRFEVDLLEIRSTVMRR